MRITTYNGHMYIAILGRQPEIGIAELERMFGGNNVTPFSSQTATFEATEFDIQDFGGILKAGQVQFEMNNNDWRTVGSKIINFYSEKWSTFEGKITIGISVYDMPVKSRDIQQTGITLKQKLKQNGVSLRLVPNNDPALSTATSHHNKLGLSNNKVELIIVKGFNGKIIVAESTGSQNITSYARRDQERPKRDAFVGMLPPKLAQIMVNLAVGNVKNPELTILDPFCGTGVVLQEALLRGYKAYGTDLSDKMIEYSEHNLQWFANRMRMDYDFKLDQGDAMTKQWTGRIDAVACESYLGQPFSAPPSPSKRDEVVKTCNHIITEFLINIRSQIEPGTRLCIAVPAWRDNYGNFTHLPLIEAIGKYGYKPHEFHNLKQKNLMYYRDDQVVARELLVITKV